MYVKVTADLIIHELHNLRGGLDHDLFVELFIIVISKILIKNAEIKDVFIGLAFVFLYKENLLVLITDK